MIADRVLQRASKPATSHMLDKRSCHSTLNELLNLQVHRFEDLMDQLLGLNRLVVIPKRTRNKKPEIFVMKKTTAIQKEVFKLLHHPLR